jgi:hypothetical protein
MGLQKYISVDTVWSRPKNGEQQITHTGATVNTDRKEKRGQRKQFDGEGNL